MFVATQNGGGYVQQTTAAIACTFDPASLVPGYTILHYHWSGLDFGATPPDSATATGYAHGPGALTVSCAVDVVANDPGAQPYRTDPYKSKPVYVVGGPITLGVNGGISGTPPHDPAATNQVGYWYIENFGFNPSGSAPQGAQSPQNGTANATGGQPSGTTYEWTIPSPLVYLSGSTKNQAGIFVGASDGSGGSSIKPQLKYKFDNGDTSDPVNGTIDDDSDNTPGLYGPDLTAYRFDAHKPKNLLEIDPGMNNPTQNGSNYHNDRQYKYQLHDDGDAIMGFVYVVERFAQPQNWDTAYYIWPPTADGTLTDTFSIDLNYADPTDHWVFTHFYDAGTTDTSQGANSGVLVLTTTTHIGTTTISNGGGQKP